MKKSINGRINRIITLAERQGAFFKKDENIPNNIEGFRIHTTEGIIDIDTRGVIYRDDIGLTNFEIYIEAKKVFSYLYAINIKEAIEYLKIVYNNFDEIQNIEINKIRR